MPSSTVFVNPVVAQQMMAADQYALQQRAMDLADRNSFLDGIRQSQESARKYDVEKEKNKNSRADSEGRNKIGQTNADTAKSQGDRRLSLDEVIAGDNRDFGNKQLETTKYIAQINAAAGNMRPQDRISVAEKVKQHNDEANSFNGAAKNAALMIKGAADDLKKLDDKVISAASGWKWGSRDAAAAVKGRPYEYYYRKALESNPKLAELVDLDGNNVVPRSVKLVAPNSNGTGWNEIDPPAGSYRPPAPPNSPAAAPENPAKFIQQSVQPSTQSGFQYPDTSGFYNPNQGVVSGGGAQVATAQPAGVRMSGRDGRAFTVSRLDSPMVQSPQAYSNPAAYIPAVSVYDQAPVDWNTNPSYQDYQPPYQQYAQ